VSIYDIDILLKHTWQCVGRKVHLHNIGLYLYSHNAMVITKDTMQIYRIVPFICWIKM